MRGNRSSGALRELGIYHGLEVRTKRPRYAPASILFRIRKESRGIREKDISSRRNTRQSLGTTGNSAFFKTREGEKYPDSDEESVYEWVEDNHIEIIEESGLGVIRDR